jgi:hypothetical protein
MRSALDTLRQTYVAIEAYNRANGNLKEDERYLAIYGLLQAMVVQQDALCHLAEALQVRPIRLNRHRRLEEIRNIRNWTVGHPTKADRHLVPSHHAIRRPKLGRGGFALYSAFDDGRTQYTYVPLPQLARLQRRVVSRLLRDMIAELQQRDRRPPAAQTKAKLQPQVHAQKPQPVAQQQPRVAQVASPWKSAARLKPNGHAQPLRANTNGKAHHRPYSNGNRKQPNGNGNGKHHRRAAFRPEPRTWLEKANPPQLLISRRAARLASQPM